MSTVSGCLNGNRFGARNLADSGSRQHRRPHAAILKQATNTCPQPAPGPPPASPLGGSSSRVTVSRHSRGSDSRLHATSRQASSQQQSEEVLRQGVQQEIIDGISGCKDLRQLRHLFDTRVRELGSVELLVVISQLPRLMAVLGPAGQLEEGSDAQARAGGFLGTLQQAAALIFTQYNTEGLAHMVDCFTSVGAVPADRWLQQVERLSLLQLANAAADPPSVANSGTDDSPPGPDDQRPPQLQLLPLAKAFMAARYKPSQQWLRSLASCAPDGLSRAFPAVQDVDPMAWMSGTRPTGSEPDDEGDEVAALPAQDLVVLSRAVALWGMEVGDVWKQGLLEGSYERLARGQMDSEGQATLLYALVSSGVRPSANWVDEYLASFPVSTASLPDLLNVVTSLDQASYSPGLPWVSRALQAAAAHARQLQTPVSGSGGSGGGSGAGYVAGPANEQLAFLLFFCSQLAVRGARRGDAGREGDDGAEGLAVTLDDAGQAASVAIARVARGQMLAAEAASDGGGGGGGSGTGSAFSCRGLVRLLLGLLRLGGQPGEDWMATWSGALVSQSTQDPLQPEEGMAVLTATSIAAVPLPGGTTAAVLQQLLAGAEAAKEARVEQQRLLLRRKAVSGAVQYGSGGAGGDSYTGLSLTQATQLVEVIALQPAASLPITVLPPLTRLISRHEDQMSVPESLRVFAALSAFDLSGAALSAPAQASSRGTVDAARAATVQGREWLVRFTERLPGIGGCGSVAEIADVASTLASLSLPVESMQAVERLCLLLPRTGHSSDGAILGAPGSGYDPWVEILQAFAYLDYSPEDPAWWSVFHSSTLIRLGSGGSSSGSSSSRSALPAQDLCMLLVWYGQAGGYTRNAETDSSPSGADSGGDGGSEAARWQDAVTEQIKLQLVSPTMSGSSSRSGGQEAVAANIPELLRTLSEAIARGFQPSASLMAAVQSSTATAIALPSAAARVIASAGSALEADAKMDGIDLAAVDDSALLLLSSSLQLFMGAEFRPSGAWLAAADELALRCFTRCDVTLMALLLAVKAMCGVVPPPSLVRAMLQQATALINAAGGGSAAGRPSSDAEAGSQAGAREDLFDEAATLLSAVMLFGSPPDTLLEAAVSDLLSAMLDSSSWSGGQPGAAQQAASLTQLMLQLGVDPADPDELMASMMPALIADGAGSGVASLPAEKLAAVLAALEVWAVLPPPLLVSQLSAQLPRLAREEAAVCVGALHMLAASGMRPEAKDVQAAVELIEEGGIEGLDVTGLAQLVSSLVTFETGCSVGLVTNILATSFAAMERSELEGPEPEDPGAVISDAAPLCSLLYGMTGQRDTAIPGVWMEAFYRTTLPLLGSCKTRSLAAALDAVANVTEAARTPFSSPTADPEWMQALWESVNDQAARFDTSSVELLLSAAERLALRPPVVLLEELLESVAASYDDLPDASALVGLVLLLQRVGFVAKREWRQTVRAALGESLMEMDVTSQKLVENYLRI
ncbi:MAG: hypothetical protein WDW38_007699 [Sanguina aurantia]